MKDDRGGLSTILNNVAGSDGRLLRCPTRSDESAT